MPSLDTIRRLKIEYSVTGADEVTRKVKIANAAVDETGEASERAALRSEKYEAALKRQAQMSEVVQQIEQSQRMQMEATLQLQAAQMQQMQQAAIANDNYSKSSAGVTDALRIGAKAAAEQGANYLATTAKWAAGAVVLGALAGTLGTLYLAYKIIKTGVDLVNDAWDLGNAKLAEYVEIGKKAADVSTDFYQRMTKSAAEAKLPVDDLTAAMTKLATASTEKLGGSDLQNRIDALKKAGNFQGNAGVTDFGLATNTEQRFSAVVKLIHEANDAGERLASLDIAERAFGPKLAENLRKDAEYLDRMKAKADSILPVDIVSAEQIGRATELQARYDAATKILSERWHPLQNILTDLGIRMKEVWVGIVESIASAATWLEKMVTAAMRLPSRMWDMAKGGFATLTGTGEQFGPVYVDPKVTATNALRAGLQNPNAVTQARDQVNAVQDAVWKDKSKEIKQAVTEAKDALDRAMESVEKYIQTTEAAAKTVDAGVFEQEKAKVIAQLTAAAMRDGKTNLAAYAAEWEVLGNRAGQAARELKIAQVQSQIKFDRDTIGLSPVDVQIASALRTIYPDVATALASVEAAEMRFNAVTRQSTDAVATFGENLIQAFASGKTGLDALLPAISSLGSSLTKIGTDSLKSGLSTLLKGGGLSGFDPTSLGIGAVGIGLSFISSAIDKKAKEQEAAEKAAQEALDRINGYNQRAEAAVIDTTPLAGDLATYDFEVERKAA